ncbi:hypothetical protein EJB05_01747, partial [Eragrostis curvula]
MAKFSNGVAGVHLRRRREIHHPHRRNVTLPQHRCRPSSTSTTTTTLRPLLDVNVFRASLIHAALKLQDQRVHLLDHCSELATSLKFLRRHRSSSTPFRKRQSGDRRGFSEGIIYC